MDFELEATTDAGRQLVKLAEDHATDFAERAAQHDAEATFAFENYAAMQESGFMAACVPESLGGLGVDSVHDLAVAFSRLGRGDASTAIGANMHVAPPLYFTRLWHDAQETGQPEVAEGLHGLLSTFGANQVVLCCALTEPGTSMGFPLTEATAVEGGFLLNGRKTFATNAPIASLVAALVRLPDGAGGYLTGMAAVPVGSPGMVIRETWDALGMRASGSHDIVFQDCFVAADGIMPFGRWGHMEPGEISAHIIVNLPLVAAFLGVAEAARSEVVRLVTTRRKAPSGRVLAERYSIQHAVAEIEVDLAAARAALARVGRHVDHYLASHRHSEMTLAELVPLMKDFQCAGLFVKAAAIRIVDRALTASGGIGYLASSPLSRLYRDVRAGPFMQPYSPNEAYEYIGKAALGLSPELDL